MTGMNPFLQEYTESVVQFFTAASVSIYFLFTYFYLFPFILFCVYYLYLKITKFIYLSRR